ncbi:MAG: shikimate dehydrogenase [Ignavibacteriales bacterium]
MSYEITAKTCITGLVGNPVEHSVSPIFQNKLCYKMNINSVYLPFKVEQGDLIKVIEAFKALNIKGFNVTIPYKTDVLDLLDEVTDEALLIGAVNTVKIVENKLYGYNTDGLGFIRALESRNVEIKDKNVIVLGAGGAARAAVVKLAQKGAKKIIILNRTQDKAKILSDLVNKKVADIAVNDELTNNTLRKYAADCNMLINTTSVGMWPDINKCIVDSEEIFTNKPVVFDMIYNPFKTNFLSLAEKNSCNIINGLGMLVYQGVCAFEIWHDVNVPLQIGTELITNLKEYFVKMQDFK